MDKLQKPSNSEDILSGLRDVANQMYLNVVHNTLLSKGLTLLKLR
jgi:hypothetical protein